MVKYFCSIFIKKKLIIIRLAKIFIYLSLIKDYEKRSNCTELLSNKFIAKNFENGLVIALIKLIIDELKKEEAKHHK